MDGRQPPEQAAIIFEAVEGVYGPQNTPMLWRCIIAETKERFEGRTHPQPPQKTTFAISGGCLPSIRSIGFPPAAAMVVAVVMPVVFCPKATE
jgi:hypothetical protein